MLYSRFSLQKAAHDHIYQPKLIDLQPLLARSTGRFLAEHLTYPVEKLLSMHFLNELYAPIAPHTYPYQRHYGCLGLLWKGIGAFLMRQQRYTQLFGPVSISQEYHAASQNLMVQFLQEHKRHAELAAYVTPRHPYRGKPPAGLDMRSLRACIQHVEDVTRLI